MTPPTVDPHEGDQVQYPDQDRQGQGVRDVQGQQHEVVPDGRHDRGQDVAQHVATDPEDHLIGQQPEPGAVPQRNEPVQHLLDPG